MDITVQAIGAGAITVLSGAIGVLWKELAKCRKETRQWQNRWAEEHDKRIEDLKHHNRSSELFLSALEKQRSKSSAPSAT